MWYRPETMSHALVRGGSQLPYNEKIRACRFFVLMVGKNIGKHTEEEFNLALERFRETGSPLIFPYFLNVMPSMEVLRFRDRIRKDLDIGEEYVSACNNLTEILSDLHIELIRGGAFAGNAPPSDREEAAKKGLDGIRELIREQREKIGKLSEPPETPEKVMGLTDAYEEVQRLVQEYHVEPGTLYEYVKFLWKQQLHEKGVQTGKWLENYYRLENADESEIAKVKNAIGALYYESNRHGQAEPYYRDTLDIMRRLTARNPDVYEPNLAQICNNLAGLLYTTNRMEEAERYFREAVTILRRLAARNPNVYEPNLAQICNNLGILLDDTDRKEEAERYYREAVTIQRRLAARNPDAYEPDLAHTCNNLGILLNDTNRKEEAERYYREAVTILRRLAARNPDAYEPDLAKTCNNLGVMLIAADHMETPATAEQIQQAEPYLRDAEEIWSRYAKANPGAYEPDLAMAYYNLGVLEYKRHDCGIARRFFTDSLALFEKYPHCAERAQQVRGALARL